MNPPRRFLIRDAELSGQFRMEERTMARCGFCSMLSSLLRRAMCVRSRRGSSESYYRELGDQDTLKMEDRASDVSENIDADNQHTRPEIHPRPKGSHDEVTKHHRFLTIHKRRKKRLPTRSLENNTALLDDISMGQVKCLLNQTVYWTFNAFTLDTVSGGRCLPVLCLHLFHTYGLIRQLNLDVVKLWKLFTTIEEGYHNSNPYHNSIHAADVTQAMHCFLQQKRIRDHIQPVEIMASLIAAMAHDIDHPGVNQSFLIATSNHLATLYRNTSVLENHHWRSALSCLNNSGIFDQMPESRDLLRHQISSLILATDITRQQEYLTQFKKYLDTDTLDMTRAEHRHLVLQIALKCADISNPCRPWEISRQWSLKVCEEFFRQGDFERKLRLPVSGLCDRNTTSIPKIQLGFFKFIVTPLIKEWHRFLRNDLSTEMIRNLFHNQRKWDSLLAKEVAKELGKELSDSDDSANEEDIEISSDTNMSDSSELLLPPRRSSVSQAKQRALKARLRRFSVPLYFFQDSKNRGKGGKNRAASVVEYHHRDSATSPTSSEDSIHSQISVRGQCEHSKVTPEKVPSSEILLPDSSIALITTPLQAIRLNTVTKDGCTWKLVRQQTFPPLEPPKDHSLTSRSLHTSNEDTIHSSRFKTELPKFDLTAYKKEGLFSNLFTRLDTDKTDNIADGSQSNLEATEPPRILHKKNETKRRESIAVGSQLRDNLTSVQLGGLDSDHLLRRRKSMPADVVAFTPKDKKVREMTAAIPQFLRRTLSGKESCTRRRGSAPSPIAPSELRGLASSGVMHHSANGGSKKPNPIVTCQQWLAKATYSVQEKPFQPLPRRSSLPVEVYHPTDGTKPTDKPK